MATPEKWLRSAIVGATTAGVYPVMAPQNASLPIVVYRRSGTTRSRNIQSQTGMPVATFSVATVTIFTPETSPVKLSRARRTASPMVFASV